MPLSYIKLVVAIVIMYFMIVLLSANSEQSEFIGWYIVYIELYKTGTTSFVIPAKNNCIKLTSIRFIYELNLLVSRRPSFFATIADTTASPVTLVHVCIIPTNGYRPMTRLTASAGTPICGIKSAMQTRFPPGTPGLPTERTIIAINRDNSTLGVTGI